MRVSDDRRRGGVEPHHVQHAAVVRISEADRQLFATSRTTKRSVTDADRPRKYLARYGITWAQARGD